MKIAARLQPTGMANTLIQNMVPKAYISAGAPSTRIAEIKERTMERETGMTDIDL